MARYLPWNCLFMLFLCAAAAQPATEVRGSVRNASDGRPVANATLTLSGTLYLASSDAAGRFSLAGVGPGDYELRASAGGFWTVTAHLHLDRNEVRELDVLLNPNTQRRVDVTSLQSALTVDPVEQGAPSQFSLTGNAVRSLSGVLLDDPLRAIQSLPGVSSNDDFEARFSLRGADFSRIGVYLDGILLHEPFHTVETTTASGSITAFNSDLIQQVDLYAGAYPVRFGDRSAGILDIQTREGKRDRYAVRIAASFAKASLLAEGPFGTNSRCSWLGGYRKTYLQYLLAHTNNPSLAFGVADAQGSLSCDVSPRNNVAVKFIDSATDLDRSRFRNKLGVNSLLLAAQQFDFADVTWRSTPTNKLLLVNRAAWTRESFDDRNPSRRPLGAGAYHELVWGSNATWFWNARQPLEVGGDLRQVHDDGRAQQYQLAVPLLMAYHGRGTLSGEYVEQSWAALHGRLHMTAGGRWDRHSVDQVTAFSPHAAVAFSPYPSLRLQAGWGQYVQYPEISQFHSNLGGHELLPLRSTQAIASAEQRINDRTRVRAEFYDRQDRDLLFRPASDPRLVNGRVWLARPLSPYQNSLRGDARGVEVFLMRTDGARFDGWISYAFGHTRLHDGVTQLSFPSDWDQRHTANLYASYRLRPTLTVSVRSAYGSGFPVPGFFTRYGSRYYLTGERNRLRVGTYERTDVRVGKSWTRASWKTTLFGEVMNVTNQTNRRFDSFNGYNPKTGQASVTMDRLLPLLPSVGILVER